MEAELKDATGPERTTLLYLLSVQYENKGDVKRANEYLEQVRNVFEAAVGPDAGTDDGGRG